MFLKGVTKTDHFRVQDSKLRFKHHFKATRANSSNKKSDM